MPRTSTQTRSHSRVGFFIVSLLLALHPEALLAGSLQGRLLDQDAGRPVSGAVLTLSAPSGAVCSVRSDTTGTFRLENLATGTWDLRVERLGYRPLQGHIQIGAAPTSVELHLQSLPMFMDELVVRARRDSEGKHIASFVETIALGNQRVPGADLAQTLDRATGVNIRRYGGLGSFSTLSIRGSTAEQVQVFLDGVPLNQAVGGGVDLGGLPIGGVESVDIYRGAVPARFGGNSLGGVVHIRTQPLGGKIRTRLHTATGSHSTRQLGASLSGPYKGWEYLGLVNYRASRNDFRFWNDNGTEYNAQDDGWARRLNSDFRGLRGLAKIGRSLGASRLQIHNTFDLSYKGIPGIGNNQSLHTRYDTWHHIAEAALFGPLGHSRAGVPTQSPPLARKIRVPRPARRSGPRPPTRPQHHPKLGPARRSECPAARPVSAHCFCRGSARNFCARRSAPANSHLLRSRRRALAVGTEVEVPLGQRLTFNAGTQAEGLNDRLFDRKNFAPSAVLPSRDNGEILGGYRMGAALDLGAGLALKAHNGRYHRAPNFFELFGDRGAVIGNTNLVSEEGHNWDLGLVFRRRDDGVGLILAEAVYYRNHVEDLIRFIQNSQRVSRPHNMGRALLRGVETRLEARLLPRLTLRGNYAYQRAENRTPFSFERGNDLPNAPRHRLNTRLSLDLGSAEIYGEFSRESRHFLDRANLRTVPVRALYNFGGTVPLVGGIFLSWELRNLTDNQVADLWGYPLPGRSYGLSMQYAM